MAGDAAARAQTKTFSLEEALVIPFNEVLVGFSDEEWELLTKEQRQLYWETLQENYCSLLFIGGFSTNPKDVFTWIEKNKRSIRISSRFLCNLPPAILASNERPFEMDVNGFPEQVGPPEGVTCKEEDTTHHGSETEGQPGQPCVSAPEQGGEKPQTESMEAAAPAQVTLEELLRPCYVWVELLPISVSMGVPQRPAELQPFGTTVLPPRDFATGGAQPVEETPPAGPTCGENRADPRRPVAAAAPSRRGRKRFLLPPSPREAPREEIKPYFCVWCDEHFRLQINLEVHYRYCRRKPKQQLELLLKTEETPDGQEASGPGSIGTSAGPVVPQNTALPPPSFDVKAPLLRFQLSQPPWRPSAVRKKYAADAGKGLPKTRRKLLSTISAMKRLYRCSECGEKFVYKWQLLLHMRSCEGAQDDVAQVPPTPPDPAPEAVPETAEAPLEEPPFEPEPEPRPSTSQDNAPYQCNGYGERYMYAYRPPPERQRRYKCLWCEKVFPFLKTVMEHQQLHYQEGEENHCPTCGKAAAYNSCFCMVEVIVVPFDSDDSDDD